MIVYKEMLQMRHLLIRLVEVLRKKEEALLQFPFYKHLLVLPILFLSYTTVQITGVEKQEQLAQQVLQEQQVQQEQQEVLELVELADLQELVELMVHRVHPALRALQELMVHQEQAEDLE